MKNTFLTKFSAVSVSLLSFAAATFALNQTHLALPIADGIKSIDIVNSATGASVANPAVTMSSITFGYSVQNSTGTLGTAAEMIRVYNPTSGATWTATVAARDGITSTWQVGSYTMDYNDPAASGGKLRITPTTGTITSQTGNVTNVSLGSQATFNQGVVDNITLFSAAAGASTYNYFNLVGVGLNQQIPASQQVGAYTLDLTLTIV